MRKLYTSAGEALQGRPWQDYPRPQMVREDWLNLNGDWFFRSEPGGPGGGAAQQGLIRVPFCPESLLSGVKEAPKPGDRLDYRRSFTIPDEWGGRRILLHFGAVMRACEAQINGRTVAQHNNGYLPFSADVTEYLREGANELRVRCDNDLDPRFPWGKQTGKRGGMWYTPCSGIWQSVWLEPVPEDYIRALHITNGADWVEIEAEGVTEGRVELDGSDYPLREGRARIEIKNPRHWSPEDPYLYEFALTSGKDRVSSYFALRTLSTETVDGVPRLCLNGKPYFFNGLLDQGYWSDGLYTPASPACFEDDIRAMKALGFNTLRKHIKIEPELFYFACDRLGMVVFQDMVNNGTYRFFRDTLLPTLRVQRLDDRRLNRDPETRRNFLQAMEDTVRQLRNHPCVCLWTIFNEGWGQFCADEAYDRLKSLDPSRFVDSSSGWFRQKRSDVDSRHVYFVEPKPGTGPLPQLLSEFGGYVWKDPAHSFNLDKTYGYRIFRDRESFVSALRELYRTLIPLKQRGLCGAVYTQVSDVEDETNGLLTFDRRVQKVRPEELRPVMNELLK